MVEGRVAVVEEVDVDSVGVMLRANWSDGLEGFTGFAPAATCHGA